MNRTTTKMKHPTTIFYRFIFCCCTSLVLLSACSYTDERSRRLLDEADSLQLIEPEASLERLQQISRPNRLAAADRALYALLLTQAKDKTYQSHESDSLIMSAVHYYRHRRQPLLLSRACFYAGCVYRGLDSLSLATNFYLEALCHLPVDKETSFFEPLIYSDLGDVYHRSKLYAESTKAYKQSFCLHRERGDSLRMAYTLKDLASAYMFEYKWDSAHVTINQGLAMAVAGNYNELQSIFYKQLASIYEEKKEYQLAKQYLDKAFPVLLHYGDKEVQYALYSYKGDILDALGMTDSAFHYWKMATGSTYIYTKASNDYHLYSGLVRQKRYKEALPYIDEYVELCDSIDKMNNREEIVRLMDKHELELYKQQLKARQDRLYAWSVFLGMLLLVAALFFLLWKDRRRRQHYIRLQNELTAERLKLMDSMAHPETATQGAQSETGNRPFSYNQFAVCTKLFSDTSGGKLLAELIKLSPKSPSGSKMMRYRRTIVNDIRSCFSDVMFALMASIPSLQSDDCIYCILWLLHVRSEVITDVLNVESGALRTRKSRIKQRMGKELFEELFNNAM